MGDDHRPPDELDHSQQAATDACSWVEALVKGDSWPTGASGRLSP
jgi:hypothetical protein